MARLSKKNIMVLDSSFSDELKDALVDEGFFVDVFSTVDEGLNQFDQKDYMVIVANILLEGKDGSCPVSAFSDNFDSLIFVLTYDDVMDEVLERYVDNPDVVGYFQTPIVPKELVSFLSHLYL